MKEELLKTKKCSICKEEFYGWGNNANPVNNGICCNKCNFSTIGIQNIDNHISMCSDIKNKCNLELSLSRIEEKLNFLIHNNKSNKTDSRFVISFSNDNITSLINKIIA
jgi:hypothetical protein